MNDEMIEKCVRKVEEIASYARICERREIASRLRGLAFRAECQPHPWAEDWTPAEIVRFIASALVDNVDRLGDPL